MKKTFRYRLYPTKAQVTFLEDQLREACRLYNAALQERRDAYRKCGISINYCDQANQLKQIRADGDLTLANFSCCQDVLRRVDKTFKAFFARVKRGDKPGFPRFKPHRRFDSITFPTYGDGVRLLENGKLRLQGAGHIKVKLHRPIEGTVKTVSLKREAGKWYACFSVEVSTDNRLGPAEEVTGVDVGLKSFLSLADGTSTDNPRHFKKSQDKLRRAQRRVSRRPNKRSKGRRKAVLILQKVHAHIRNQRLDFHHKVSRELVNRFGLIAVEDLNIKGLAGGMLAKSVSDAGWSAFINMLAYKAEDAGRQLVKVDPRGTSQRCVCGMAVPKDLGDRWHDCPSCGLSVDRDHASAMEILRLGLSLVAST